METLIEKPGEFREPLLLVLNIGQGNPEPIRKLLMRQVQRLSDYTLERPAPKLLFYI